jgi:hypothetical protein
VTYRRPEFSPCDPRGFRNRTSTYPIRATFAWDVDPFAHVAIDPDRDPFDANQAIPTLLFAAPTARGRVEQVIPSLRVRSVNWLSLFAYPMSGGLQNWSLIPAALVRPVLALERKVPEAIRRQIAFRMIIVLERRE